MDYHQLWTDWFDEDGATILWDDFGVEPLVELLPLG